MKHEFSLKIEMIQKIFFFKQGTLQSSKVPGTNFVSIVGAAWSRPLRMEPEPTSLDQIQRQDYELPELPRKLAAPQHCCL